jgi:hypothetical protein
MRRRASKRCALALRWMTSIDGRGSIALVRQNALELDATLPLGTLVETALQWLRREKGESA